MPLPCVLRGLGSLTGLIALSSVLVADRAAPAHATPGIAPHMAVYKLGLGKTKGGQAVTHANGRIEFKWNEGCDGWTISQRTIMVLSNSQGRELQSSWTLDAWESKDGLSYRFAVRRSQGGEAPVETRGKARLDGPDLGGRVDYSAPEERMVTLPKGTLFPTQHSLEVLAAALGRELLLWRTVFDGTGEAGLFGVNVAVSQAFAPSVAPSFESPLIAGVQSWRVSVAYFDVDQQTAEPDHEQVMRIYANGVVDELKFDYSDFALEASLERLEALPSPECP